MHNLRATPGPTPHFSLRAQHPWWHGAFCGSCGMKAITTSQPQKSQKGPSPPLQAGAGLDVCSKARGRNGSTATATKTSSWPSDHGICSQPFEHPEVQRALGMGKGSSYDICLLEGWLPSQLVLPEYIVGSFPLLTNQKKSMGVTTEAHYSCQRQHRWSFYEQLHQFSSILPPSTSSCPHQVHNNNMA